MFKSKKSQILVAHQKEDMDGTKNYSYPPKKVWLGFRGFRTYFWEVDHPLCDV